MHKALKQVSTYKHWTLVSNFMQEFRLGSGVFNIRRIDDSFLNGDFCGVSRRGWPAASIANACIFYKISKKNLEVLLIREFFVSIQSCKKIANYVTTKIRFHWRVSHSKDSKINEDKMLKSNNGKIFVDIICILISEEIWFELNQTSWNFRLSILN